MKVAYLICKNNQEGYEGGDDIDSMLSNFEKSNKIFFTTLSDAPKVNFWMMQTSLETIIHQTKMNLSLFLPLSTVKEVLSIHLCPRSHQLKG